MKAIEADTMNAIDINTVGGRAISASCWNEYRVTPGAGRAVPSWFVSMKERTGLSDLAGNTSAMGILEAARFIEREPQVSSGERNGDRGCAAPRFLRTSMGLQLQFLNRADSSSSLP